MEPLIWEIGKSELDCIYSAPLDKSREATTYILVKPCMSEGSVSTVT